MVMKRKTVSKLASALKATSKHSVDEVDRDEDMQIVAVEEQKEVSENELVAMRTKELKAMSAEEMKKLLLSNGLDAGKKEDMIKNLLKHEAKARKAAQEQKARIRAVVVKKKQELEGQSLSELGKRCDSAGIKGSRSKEERVQRLLVQWQEADGVDKALAQIALDERKQELDAMDSSKLLKLCEKIRVDPFVKEIMVDRLSKREAETGRYSRPALVQEQEVPKDEKKVDMIDALLASEAQRKKEQEVKNQQEEAACRKMKELKSLPVEDLKKRLAKKGLEAPSKKEEMVAALIVAGVQEEALAARESELKTKSLQELKDLLLRHSLEVGTKEQMIKTMLAHEARCREELKAFEVRVGEVVVQKKIEFEAKSNAKLKEMCQAKYLPVGGGKEERIQRLVEEIQKDGSLDQVVSRNIRNKRKEELMSMDKPAVLKLCEKAAVDPIIKDIVVERIVSHESEGGDAIAMADAETSVGPAAKRARVAKK